MKNSKLDDLANFAKSLGDKKPTNTVVKAQRPRPQPRRYANPLVKSAGRGGIQFDFGSRTGCAIADNATALINQHADPVQAETVRQQSNDINRAFSEYIELGESQWQGRQLSQDGGSPMKQWSDQLGSSTDDAIKAMAENGELDCSEAGMPSVGPAIKNDFNKQQITMGSEVVKATSETDAALIKMMNSQGLDENDGLSEECID